LNRHKDELPKYINHRDCYKQEKKSDKVGQRLKA